MNRLHRDQGGDDGTEASGMRDAFKTLMDSARDPLAFSQTPFSYQWGPHQSYRQRKRQLDEAISLATAASDVPALPFGTVAASPPRLTLSRAELL